MKITIILFMIIGISYNSYCQNNKLKEVNNINLLFKNLFSSNKDLAQNSFIKLSNCPSEKVIQEINKKSDFSSYEKTYSRYVPNLKFLNQIVLFTNYCRVNNIVFDKNINLRDKILKLKSYRLPSDFSKKYALENEIIQSLNLINISEMEYWSLIYSQEYPISVSAGRILNIFYSKNFDKIIANEKYIKLYLKKSAIFDNLETDGICTKYRYKFYKSDIGILDKLLKEKNLDIDIKYEIEKIKHINDDYILTNKTIDWNEQDTSNYYIPNITNTLNYFKIQENNITTQISDSLIEVLSFTNFSQIPIVLNFLDNSKYSNNEIYYRILEYDFGFFTLNNSQNSEFRRLFNTNSITIEEKFYLKMLDDAGIDYKSPNQSLDFNKIYQILKYDIVEGFVGGSSLQDFETFAIIRLLQIHFKTRLGFSNKQCRSRKWDRCANKENCCIWMEYLISNNLVDIKNKYPISFNSFIDEHDRNRLK